MGMRTDCRHYSRRTSAAGEVREGCRINAAPDAPYSCPENCPLFERVSVSRAGWQVGSLGAADTPRRDAARPPLPAEAEGLFDTLGADFDPTTVARIEDEERRRQKGRPWWKKKRR